jgi:hypothetical protein
MSFHFSACVPGSSWIIPRVFCTITLALLLQFVPTQLPGVFAQTPQRGPLKFDPLTPEERELAAKLAEGDERVKKLRGPGRQLLVSVELSTAKTDNPNDNTSRFAEVLYYRYEGNQGVLALVDLQRRAITLAESINGDAVPLVAAEVNQALAIALQDRTLVNLLGPNYKQYQVSTLDSREGRPNQVEALRVLASSPQDRCYRHRCLSLLFRQGDTFLTGTSVIVDLTAQNVRVEQPGVKRAHERRRER